MIRVWTDAADAGLLDRHGERGSTFAYLPGAPEARAVSMTMPVRLPEAIWETTPEVHSYAKEHPEFAGIGQRMLREWESGVSASLRG